MAKPKNYTGWVGQMKPDGGGKRARPVPFMLRPPGKPECNFLVFSRMCGWRNDSDFKNFAGDSSLPNKIPSRKDLWVPTHDPERGDPPREIFEGEWMGKDGALVYHDEELDRKMKLLDEAAEKELKAPHIGVPREPVYDPENPNWRQDAMAGAQADVQAETEEG